MSLHPRGRFPGSRRQKRYLYNQIGRSSLAKRSAKRTTSTGARDRALESSGERFAMGFLFFGVGLFIPVQIIFQNWWISFGLLACVAAVAAEFAWPPDKS